MFIKELRERLNLTQSEFAKNLNINQAIVSRYENKKLTPTSEFIIRLIKTFNANPNFIFFGKEPYLNENTYKNEISQELNQLIDELSLYENEKNIILELENSALEKIISSKPELITVYTLDKIKQINEVANKLGLVQGIMIRLTDDDSLLYSGQVAGFGSNELENLINEVARLSNVEIRGLTVFPALLFNSEANEIKPTANINALNRGKAICEEMGLNNLTINIPSCTCVNSMKLIHDLGGNNGEPGHGLSGTTPLHAISDETEKVAYCYVSEISHNYKENSYCYGGGNYRRGHLKNVLVGDSLANAMMTEVFLPDDDSIDYHFEIKGNHRVGLPCLMSFRTQIFTTRSNVVIVEGLSNNDPKMYLYDALGREIGVNWK